MRTGENIKIPIFFTIKDRIKAESFDDHVKFRATPYFKMRRTINEVAQRILETIHHL